MVRQSEGLLLLAALDFGIQLFFGLLAILLSTEKFFDLCGGTSFLVLAVYGLFLQDNPASDVSHRQLANAVMVAIWAVRLSCFLFYRVLKAGEDRRFRKAKKNPFLFIFIWMLQGVWVYASGLAVYITNVRSYDSNKVDIWMVLGWAVFAFGFLLENIADFQKTRWRAKPENKGMWIDVGVWSLCQHPNYMGEMLLWFGIYISNVSSYEGWEHIGIISPLFTFALIRFVSGVPALQAYAKKKWGSNTDWQRYHSTTPLLLFCFKCPCPRPGSSDDDDAYVSVPDA